MTDESPDLPYNKAGLDKSFSKGLILLRHLATCEAPAGISDLSAALDVGPDRIASLPAEHLLAWVDGAPPVVLRRPTCYADADLKDLCDPGPFFDPDFVEEDIKPFPRRAGSEGDGGAEPDLMQVLFGTKIDAEEDEIEMSGLRGSPG